LCTKLGKTKILTMLRATWNKTLATYETPDHAGHEKLRRTNTKNSAPAEIKSETYAHHFL